jgi:hypothetical protein
MSIVIRIIYRFLVRKSESPVYIAVDWAPFTDPVRSMLSVQLQMVGVDAATGLAEALGAFFAAVFFTGLFAFGAALAFDAGFAATFDVAFAVVLGAVFFAATGFLVAVFLAVDFVAVFLAVMVVSFSVSRRTILSERSALRPSIGVRAGVLEVQGPTEFLMRM